MTATATPTHFVCDPCYVLHTIDPEGTPHSESLWVKSFVEALCNAEQADDFDGHMTYMGHPIFVHSTAYGDGSYKGTDGRSYYVDAGIIGAIPVELIEDEVVQEMLNQPYVRAVNMTESQLGMADYEDGTFTFYTSEGRLEIETDPEEYECEECSSEISEYEYNDEGVCKWCLADREEQEREEEDED
jgi:hypothetical protein